MWLLEKVLPTTKIKLLVLSIGQPIFSTKYVSNRSFFACSQDFEKYPIFQAKDITVFHHYIESQRTSY